jgi:putative ABC transport system substrate-binding protein
MPFDQWKRRDFITLIGGAAATWPFAARAQQPAMPVIGYLGTETPDRWASRLRTFRQGLGESGYVEGRNVEIEYRWAEGRNERLPALASDLVRRQVAVIAAPGSTASVLAAKAATTTIPILFMTGDDPVRLGLVASLARPGGNVTGITNLSAELGPKRLELLHELVPTAASVGLLVNPTSVSAESYEKEHAAAARVLGVQLHVLRASTERDFDSAFGSLVQLRAGGLVIVPDPFFTAHDEQIAAMAIHHMLPAIFNGEFASEGGLISYGGSATDAHHQVGTYAGRILKGEKPADLPVQQATKVELIINLKTAKALGITVPQLLLGRADEIIE